MVRSSVEKGFLKCLNSDMSSWLSLLSSAARKRARTRLYMRLYSMSISWPSDSKESVSESSAYSYCLKSFGL